ncbi:MAG: FtsW/RodA/SpoVE family cell cycle protein, partial [Bacteroides sp.]
FAISIFMLTVGNVRLRHLLMIGVGVVGLAVLLLFVRIPGLNSIQNRLQRRATWEGRLQNFANGELDEGQGTQAKIAVAGGLWFGKGVGKSTQRVILPEAHKDFIYAIIVEEFGFLGGLAVMAIYLLLMWRIRIITLRCKSAYQAYLCAGIGFMICFQAFVHAFICVGFLPVTGLPLPFVSLGGNSIFVTGVGLGMVQSVARQQAKEFYEGELAESNEVQ